jgi:hypothetical protein
VKAGIIGIRTLSDYSVGLKDCQHGSLGLARCCEPCGRAAR